MKEFGKQWRLTAEIILIAAVCMAGMWQNTKKTIESISDVKKKEEEKRIAITFDDGPDGISTPVLLDGLKERGVRASFFVIGQEAEEHPDLIRRMQKEGHLIGNHTYHHVELTKVDQETERKEIEKTNEVPLTDARQESKLKGIMCPNAVGDSGTPGVVVEGLTIYERVDKILGTLPDRASREIRTRAYNLVMSMLADAIGERLGLRPEEGAVEDGR